MSDPALLVVSVVVRCLIAAAAVYDYQRRIATPLRVLSFRRRTFAVLHE